MNPSPYLFQYCQKLIIVSADKQSVLLAKRQGEADYDGVFSFVGGKMETSDESMLAGMKREKDEEIGAKTVVNVLPNETYNVMFRKKDGNAMILPHIPGVFVSGDIELSDEYSEYRWVPLAELDSFQPTLDNVPMLTRWAVKKLADADASQFAQI